METRLRAYSQTKDPARLTLHGRWILAISRDHPEIQLVRLQRRPQQKAENCLFKQKQWSTEHLVVAAIRLY